MVRYPVHFPAITLFAVAAVGCEDAPKPRPTVQAFAIDSLEFDTPELEKRFTDFDAAARLLADTGFEYQPYRRLGGNVLAAVWAKGIDFSEPCVLRGPRESLKDIHRISVGASVDPFPQVSQATLKVEVVAADPDVWCVFFDYRETSEQQATFPGLGIDWNIRFLRWDPARYGVVVPFRPYDEARERVKLPLRGYEVCDSGVGIRREVPFKDDFVRYLRSAGAMRDAYLADLAALEERVVTFIREHKAQRIVHRHDHRGLPLPDDWEPLTAEEEEAELAKAKEFFAAQAKLMRDHHEAMYAAWRESFPFERCWPELGEE